MKTDNKITIDDWVIKNEDYNRKDNKNIPRNVKEYLNEIIEDAIMHNNNHMDVKIVPKGENRNDNMIIILMK